MSRMRTEGSTTNVADLEEKIEWTPEVPVPPELGRSGKGWLTMQGYWGARTGAGVDDGAAVEAVSCMLIMMTLQSIKS